MSRNPIQYQIAIPDQRTIAKLVSIVLIIISTAAWASTGTDGVVTRLKADDLRVVQAGEVIYQANCASCHGAQLEGQPNWRVRDADGRLPAPPHDANGHTWHHDDDLLFEITKYGAAVVINDPDYQTNMPAYKGILDDNEIVAVLSFIKNTWPDEERQWQDDMNRQLGEDDSLLENDGKSILEKLFK